MNSIRRVAAVVLGLVLMLFTTPCWAEPIPICTSPGCNSTASDLNGNTAGGTSALGTFTSGVANTAFGQNALQSNSTGGGNTASGAGALQDNTTGNSNTASGVSALAQNTIGNNNTATGTDALFDNLSGSNNTASGFQALQDNTTGNSNTASGVNALVRNTTGSKNTAVGEGALRQSIGNKNIAVGFRAGESLTNGNNNVYLDNVGGSAESQTMRLGDTQTRTFIAGIVTANVSGATVEIDANGQLGIKTSSARYKRDIAPMGTSSQKVLALRPVTFAYRDDAQGVTRYGLIAEDVERVYPELVTHTATGDVQTVKYQELIPMLLNELQRQRHEFQQTLQSQQQALQLHQQELAELRALVGQGRGVASAGPTR